MTSPTTFSGHGGISLVADVRGPEDGPPALFLHGGGQTRHSWAGTLDTLAGRGWRAASLDLRGHGDSDWAPDGDYSLDAFAEDVRAVAATFTRPPALVGASLGGLSSLVAIAEHADPHAVASSLTLVDVAHRNEEVGRDRISAFMTGYPNGFATLDDAADAIAAYNPARPRPKNLEGLKKNLRQREDGRWVWHWDPQFIVGQQGSPDETRASMVDPDRLRRAVMALRLPTLLVRGAASDLLSEEGARDFVRLAPHADYAEVPGAGHMVAGDRNEIFNRAILDFLERHRPA